MQYYEEGNIKVFKISKHLVAGFHSEKIEIARLLITNGFDMDKAMSEEHDFDGYIYYRQEK